MLAVAVIVFGYYTTWALLLVRSQITQCGPHRLIEPTVRFNHMGVRDVNCWSVLTIQPFLSSTSPLQSFFPAREWAVRLPVLLLLSGMIGVSLFFGRVALVEAAKKKRTAGKAA